MSWIDIYLSDGDPSTVYGADAEKAITSMLRLRDLPYIMIGYRYSGLSRFDSLAFTFLDLIRHFAYRKGFEDCGVDRTESEFR